MWCINNFDFIVGSTIQVSFKGVFPMFGKHNWLTQQNVQLTIKLIFWVQFLMSFRNSLSFYPFLKRKNWLEDRKFNGRENHKISESPNAPKITAILRRMTIPDFSKHNSFSESHKNLNCFLKMYFLLYRPLENRNKGLNDKKKS